jgi:hypothetical protein
VPALFGFAAALALACSGVDHPPPIGSGGRGQPMPPVIVEFGGTSAGGSTPGQAGSLSTSGSLSDNFAGNGSLAGSGVGDDSFGGTTTAGAGATGGSLGDGVAGSSSIFGGNFSTGGT